MVYFQNRALQKCKGGMTIGNYIDIESQEEFWVSGIKKDTQDRHYTRPGKVFVEEEIQQEYLKLIAKIHLPRNYILSKNKIMDINILKERIFKIQNTI